MNKLDKYDLIIIGTGFAGTFFLKRYLEIAKSNARILVLERGAALTHQEHLQTYQELKKNSEQTYINEHEHKTWVYAPAQGGTSNWWWACTPRFLPADFELKTRFGVGADWPLGYEELESYYTEVEEVMQVSGSEQAHLWRRSKPYPQPPHRLQGIDEVLREKYPLHFFPQPTARARRATKNRPACCASGVCTNCPVNAKFTVLSELSHLYQDSRVELINEAEVLNLSCQNGVCSFVNYRSKGKLYQAKAEVFALGANAIFNPFILGKSGLQSSVLGKGLNEQISVTVTFDLAKHEAFNGSTSITGHGYFLYDQIDRSQEAAILIETFNIPSIRLENKKWQQRLIMKLIYEDLPRPENFIDYSGEIPRTVYAGPSDYFLKSFERVKQNLKKYFEFLPIEKMYISPISKTEGHILGTTAMGESEASSVVDPNLVHHQVRNLLVLGGSVFPTSAPANPSLTISALSLRAADKFYN